VLPRSGCAILQNELIYVPSLREIGFCRDGVLNQFRCLPVCSLAGGNLTAHIWGRNSETTEDCRNLSCRRCIHNLYEGAVRGSRSPIDECWRSMHSASGTLDPGGYNSRIQHGLY